MKQNWMKLEDIIETLHRSLNRSNQIIMNTDNDTSFTISEFSVNLAAYTKTGEERDGSLDIYYKFPDHNETNQLDRNVERESTLSRISLTIRPTVRLHSSNDN